ncbi:hypothetical protein IV203_014828 [Nitzschia inconspicua]|uniref:Uncharacterized protein n=1 Tax=Nitzschia inconspicua TaxID=303405 RepID=A0A9K3PSY3_9STRA|nr:hypothetical protein IV203_014828 [Nitzschia inconspicua]
MGVFVHLQTLISLRLSEDDCDMTGGTVASVMSFAPTMAFASLGWLLRHVLFFISAAYLVADIAQALACPKSNTRDLRPPNRVSFVSSDHLSLLD